MMPYTHFILGLLISFFIFPTYGFLSAFFFLAFTFLIDVDHYFLYIYLTKDFNLKKAVKFYTDNRFHPALATLYVFHNVEFLIFIFLLYLYFKKYFLFFAFLGLAFHYFLDYLEVLITYYKEGVFHSKNWSILYWLFEKLKK